MPTSEPSVAPEELKQPNPSSNIIENDVGIFIKDTYERYQILLSKAQKYEKEYATIDNSRKKTLEAFIKGTTNKIRSDTFHILQEDLTQLLNGQIKVVAQQSISVMNYKGKKLSLQK